MTRLKGRSHGKGKGELLVEMAAQNPAVCLPRLRESIDMPHAWDVSQAKDLESSGQMQHCGAVVSDEIVCGNVLENSHSNTPKPGKNIAYPLLGIFRVGMHEIGKCPLSLLL